MEHARDSARVLLADSMKQLVCKGIPFEKITIKEITAGAGLIRPTFYRYFVDKYALLEWIFQHDVLEPSYALIETKMIDEAISVVFKRIEMNRAFYACVLRLEGQNSFRDILPQALLRWTHRLIAAKEPDFRDDRAWFTSENVAWFYANNMAIILVYWIRQGEGWSIQDVLDAYHYFSTHTMEEALRGSS